MKLPPLFRIIDWLVLIVCFAAVWAAYLHTLAPDLTLEDSGELCTASFYAGIPHPPGYPFWAIYSWIWTVIVPFGSVAWRVEVGESFAAAMACGLVGLMVSRGSSMLIEGIEELKEMNRKWEGAICVVCGITAGLMLGFDNFMWKESVVINRISVFDVPWLMVVAVCLMRWIYAPHQRRYLYIAMFFLRRVRTIHQTMLVAAMGIEVGRGAGPSELGPQLFSRQQHYLPRRVDLMQARPSRRLQRSGFMCSRAFFTFVGISSIATYIWLGNSSPRKPSRSCAGTARLAAIAILSCAAARPGVRWPFPSFRAVIAFGVLASNMAEADLGWLVVIVCGVLWIAGVAFYFYEPIAGMTDPPMQWGYPRTVEGFFHALPAANMKVRNPTDILHDKTRFIMQLGMQVNSLADSYSWIFLFVALLPFFFFGRCEDAR